MTSRKLCIAERNPGILLISDRRDLERPTLSFPVLCRLVALTDFEQVQFVQVQVVQVQVVQVWLVIPVQPVPIFPQLAAWTAVPKHNRRDRTIRTAMPILAFFAMPYLLSRFWSKLDTWESHFKYPHSSGNVTICMIFGETKNDWIEKPEPGDIWN